MQHARWATVLIVVASLELEIAGDASAATTIEVLDTYPSGSSVTLGRNQNFYLRIAYQTDEPVRIWARPNYRGQDVKAGSNTSATYTGRGEVLGWFFLMQPGDEVDEIRIRAGDGSVDGTQVVITYPVRIVAGSQPAVSAREPAWVAALTQRAAEAQKAEYEKRMNEPVKAGDRVSYAGFMLLVLSVGIIGIGAPVRAMRRWGGGWRIAAAVPIAMLSFVLLRIVFGVARDPTSHNLWPFEILQVAALSIVIMLVLLGARKFIGVER